MRRDWDRRARRNALHFVNTARTHWNKEDFFGTGEESVRELILSDLNAICGGRDPASMRVLELGCGVGRMTRALAATFGEVHGVDISGEMVRRARRNLRAVPNAQIHRNSGHDLAVLEGLRFDFAHSYIVFQHISSRRIIERYVGEVRRVLRPGGLFKFQVQGCCDPGFRRSRRDTWIGVSVSEQEASGMAARNGFDVERMAGQGTQYFWLWFRKPSN